MTVTVLYFAQIAEKIGVNREQFELKDSVNTADLVSILKDKYPQITEQKFKIAVNQLLLQGEKELEDGAEIALLPPFAGG
ncbi:MAG: molybdopterin converting factor subunit 1 [Crocinitomicaceae bacterium]